jgi:hypothetical protein
MKINKLAIAILLIVAINTAAHAQHHTVNDSVWCDNLNELIKCASLDKISERISKPVNDSAFFAACTPTLRLSNSNHEVINKQYGKVVYECYFYSSEALDKKIEQAFYHWHEKIKKCVEVWEEARLKNTDTTLNVPDDYFITNSEDETTLRLDIYKDKGYHVRLRIF